MQRRWDYYLGDVSANETFGAQPMGWPAANARWLRSHEFRLPFEAMNSGCHVQDLPWFYHAAGLACMSHLEKPSNFSVDAQ